MGACLHCGHDVSPRALACPSCGEPGPAARPSVPPGSLGGVISAARRTDGYAIASLACSISAFVGLFLVGSILGIIFGRMARTRLAADPALAGAELAQAGIIVGWVGLAIGAVFTLVFFGALFAFIPFL